MIVSTYYTRVAKSYPTVNFVLTDLLSRDYRPPLYHGGMIYGVVLYASTTNECGQTS